MTERNPMRTIRFLRFPNEYNYQLSMYYLCSHFIPFQVSLLLWYNPPTFMSSPVTQILLQPHNPPQEHSHKYIRKSKDKDSSSSDIHLPSLISSSISTPVTFFTRTDTMEHLRICDRMSMGRSITIYASLRYQTSFGSSSC